MTINLKYVFSAVKLIFPLHTQTKQKNIAIIQNVCVTVASPYQLHIIPYFSCKQIQYQMLIKDGSSRTEKDIYCIGKKKSIHSVTKSRMKTKQNPYVQRCLPNILLQFFYD